MRDFDLKISSIFSKVAQEMSNLSSRIARATLTTRKCDVSILKEFYSNRFLLPYPFFTRLPINRIKYAF